MGSTRLWLPGQPDPDERLMVCRVITGPDETCGKVFRRGEEKAWQMHVGACARAHVDQIHAESLRTRIPILDPNSWDPEVERHMREVGERMKREGRLEVKPSERAGFS
jgi:hypothetical protein